MIKLDRPAMTHLVAMLLAGQLLILVPFTNAQQPWTSNLLNLFSDNFRNLLQQIPSAPLPTTSLSNPLLTPSSSPSLSSSLSPSASSPSSFTNPSHPLAYDAYGSRYSRSKDDILQYSDEDPSIASNGLQQTNYGYSPNYNPNYNSNYNPSPYQSPALNSFAGDYYNYQLGDGLAPQAPAAPNQFVPAKPAPFDDPLYSQYMLSKDKNLDPLNLNKNVLWNDQYNIGLDLAAYNLDNIYNNRFNYNRLPVSPAHVSFVPPPPIPNLTGSSPLANQIGNQAGRSVASDLQPAPNSLVTNNLDNGNQLGGGQPDGAPQSAYSSFLAANKEALSSLNFNLGLTPPPRQPIDQLPNQLQNPLQADQLISANSVEQKYEQAKPFFLPEKTARLTGAPVDLPAAPANLQPSVPVSGPVNVPANLPAGPSATSPTGTLPLNDLNQLYNAFATIPFNNNFNTLSNNQISGPKVIYYDNFINHQAASSQQPIASSGQAPINQQTAVQTPVPADPSNSLLLANTLDSSLSGTPSNSPSNTLGIPPAGSPPASSLDSSPSLSDTNSNSLTTLTASAGAVAPNLSSNLEVTTQPQLAKAPSKATRKKPVKIKRKNQQRTNQRDFGARNRRKDELVAIER